jgi:formate C-acetyltransferase
METATKIRDLERTKEKGTTEILRDEMICRVKGLRCLGRADDIARLGAGVPYRPGVRLDIERIRLITEAYKETEGEPVVLKRGKALARLLDNMTIWIENHEKIVGNYAPDIDSLISYPEQFYRWLDKAVNRSYSMLLNKEEKNELHELHRCWENISYQGSERNLLPEDVKPYYFFKNHGAFMWFHGARAGQVVNYDKLFKVGLNGLIKEAKDKLEEISRDSNIYLDGRQYLEKKRFLEAVIISMEAAVRWGRRYASLAGKMAEEEKCKKRKKELKDIAKACDWVPGNPPRNLHEAIQCYWFITLITRQIDVQTTGTGDRIDQILYPLFKKDKDEGRITREAAQELMEFLRIKFNELGDLTAPISGSMVAGGNMTARVLTIGGQTPEGGDATNEMSYIVLDSMRKIGMTQYAVAVRLHRNTPMHFLSAITDALKEKAGLLSFFNDEFYIPYLIAKGIPVEIARNYSIEGCMRWALPGKPMAHRAVGGMLVLPKCLEYALYQGIDRFSDKKYGYPTANPLTFTNIEEMVAAFLTQVRVFTEKMVVINNIVDKLEEENIPQPFNSAMLDGCIENATDCRTYKYFPHSLIQSVGHITVVNSLIAIKKLIFDEKKIRMDQLLDALKNNWEDKEELRQMFINAPKFGNDDDYVDIFARDLIQKTTKVMESFKNLYGGHYQVDGSGGSSYYAYSGLTGATPDGRKDRDLFNDGTVSPAIGTDIQGPTAVLNSVAKVDPLTTFNHLLNQKVQPQYLSSAYKDVFISYLKEFVDLGIHHIQFNIIDREILLDAQSHPERYSDLTVRVAGFSAYFIDMGKEMQDQIITRTEHSMGTEALHS